VELNWGLFYDSWLIDKIPPTIPLTFEEHPNGWKINPEKLTLYFGANPTYIYGTGKLYHETLFAQNGFYLFPLFEGVPNLEFIKSFKITLSEDKDWLGNPSGIYKIGRVKINDMVKELIKKFYGVKPIEEQDYFKTTTPSSDFVPPDSNELTKYYTPVYTPIFNSASAFLDKYDVKWFSTMHQRGDSIYEIKSGSYWDVETPFNSLYFSPGIYEKVLELKNSRIDITDSIANLFTSGEPFTLFFKTVPGFREGVVFDYGSTLTNETDYGFRIEVLNSGIRMIANSGKVNEFFAQYDFSFKTANSICVEFRPGENIIIRINNDTSKVFSIDFKEILIKDNVRAYISSYSISKQYVDAGNIEEFGIIRGLFDADDLTKLLSFEPLIPNKLTDSQAPDETVKPILLNQFTYSIPQSVLIPKQFESSKSLKTIDFAKKIYIANSNTQVRDVSIQEIKNIQFNKINIEPGYNFYNSVGLENAAIDSTKEYCYMIKKVTSDSHIPIKIDIEFRIPKWWTKDMNLKLFLMFAPIGPMITYSYKKFRTGEF